MTLIPFHCVDRQLNSLLAQVLTGAGPGVCWGAVLEGFSSLWYGHCSVEGLFPLPSLYHFSLVHLSYLFTLLSWFSSPLSHSLFSPIFSCFSVTFRPPPARSFSPPSLGPLDRGECLAHQEYTSTGFEYFLWWERRVREPLRSSKSVGPISYHCSLQSKHSWQVLLNVPIPAPACPSWEQTELPSAPVQFCVTRTKILRLSSPKQPGRGHSEGGANERRGFFPVTNLIPASDWWLNYISQDAVRVTICTDFGRRAAC